MKVLLLTVPVEAYTKSSYERGIQGAEVFATVNRADGVLPVCPKIAIVSIIKCMEQEGYKREDIDFYDVDMLQPDDDELTSYLLKTKPDVIGLSAVVSTCYSQVKRLSHLARAALPEALIVMGGSLSASANLVLNRSDVDICVVGDGEIAWLDLLKAYGGDSMVVNPATLRTVKGLAFLTAGKIEFTGYGEPIPGGANFYPDYDLLLSGLKDKPELLANYFRPAMGTYYVRCDPRAKRQSETWPMLAQLWTTKGCVARCTFCQRSTKGYRVFKPEGLDTHLKELRARFNVGFVHILDENFGSDKAYTKEIAAILHRNEMLWFCGGVRVSSVDAEYVQFLKDHGCMSLKFGVESGSKAVMDVMEKKFTPERVFESLKLLADRDMYSPLAFMLGMPGETNSTVKETGRFYGRLCHMQGTHPLHGVTSLFYALPLPGTPLFVYGQQKGVLGTSLDDEEAYLLNVGAVGAEKLNYPNLNGSKFLDVVWWDCLARFEALKEFYRLEKEQPLPNEKSFMQTVILRWHEIERRRPRGMGKIRSMISDLLYSKWVFGTPLAYPVTALLRIKVAIQFIYRKYYFKFVGIEYNLFKDWPKIKQLDTAAGNRPIKLSLRAIVTEKPLVTGDENYPDQVRKALSVGL
jgi:radical SAM superfamily enzyme YgiQ (UPF0313 family)